MVTDRTSLLASASWQLTWLCYRLTTIPACTDHHRWGWPWLLALRSSQIPAYVCLCLVTKTLSYRAPTRSLGKSLSALLPCTR